MACKKVTGQGKMTIAGRLLNGMHSAGDSVRLPGTVTLPVHTGMVQFAGQRLPQEIARVSESKVDAS